MKRDIANVNNVNSLITELAESIRPTTPTQQYASDPVKFCEEMLVAHLTQPQEDILRSIITHRITLVESANGVGKSFLSARAALWFLRCYPNSQVYMAAAPPEDNLKNILWGELDAALLHASPEVLQNLKRRSLSLAYAPRWWCKGVTIPTTGTPEQRQARFSGKHAPHLMFVLDEADAIPQEIWAGVESCLSGEHSKALIILNPRAPSGWVHTLRDNPDVNVINLSAFDHPNVITGQNIVPGAVDRETTVRRIQTWTRPISSTEKEEDESVFVVPDFLDGCTTATADGEERTPLRAGEVRVVVESLFDHMVLGRYPGKSGRQLVSQKWIKAANRRWNEWAKISGSRPPEKVRPNIGFDVGIDADPSVLCLRYDTWVAPFNIWKIANQDESGDMVRELAIDLDYELLAIDSGGVGGGMPHQLRKKGMGKIIGVHASERPTGKALTAEGDTIGVFYSIRDELLWKMREWLRTEDAMLPEDNLLEAELLAPTWEQDKGKVRIQAKSELRRKLGGRSTDRMDALALTFASPKTIKMGLI